jgi:predicted tellurium resistance membrane protein TerC
MEWMNWIGDPNAWVSLGTLSFLEIVLGVDNLIFTSILAGKLPRAQQV